LRFTDPRRWAKPGYRVTVCQTVSYLHTQQTPWSVLQDGWKRTHIIRFLVSSKHEALRSTHDARNDSQHRSEAHHCRRHGVSNVARAKPSIDRNSAAFSRPTFQGVSTGVTSRAAWSTPRSSLVQGPKALKGLPPAQGHLIARRGSIQPPPTASTTAETAA